MKGKLLMLFNVAPYIASSSYFFEKENSRCYIYNSKTSKEYVLYGKFADLWFVVLSKQNYEEVEKYAARIGLKDELEEFIDELKMVGLINDQENEIKNDIDNSSLADETENFAKEKINWFISNKLLSEFTIELSYKCNLACKHCYNDKDYQNVIIDVETVKKIIDEAIELGADNFYLTSGECTLHPNFIEILKYIQNKRKTFTIVTNATKLYDDETLFEELVKLYPKEIKISLYSMDPLVHDAITGVSGSHNKTVAVIKKLREKNIPVHINYFQMSINKDSLNDVMEFRKAIGASLSIGIFFLDNKQNNNSYVQITDEQLYELFLNDEQLLFKNLLNHKNKCASNKEASACKNIQSMMSVDPNLNVYPCVALKYELGNLKKVSLKKIWNDEIEKFWELYKIKNLVDCKNCEYFEYCMYCPCLGMYENGFLKKSSFCCRLTKIRMNIINNRVAESD